MPPDTNAMQPAVTINPKQTYTKSEYARAYGISRVKLDQDIKDGKIKTVPIKGTTLVIGQQ